MSKKDVHLFIEKVKSDEKLQAKLAELSTQKHEERTKSIVQLAAAAGYEVSEKAIEIVTEEELTEMVKSGEITDEQMQAITGGFDTPYLISGVDYETDGSEADVTYVSELSSGLIARVPGRRSW